MKERTQATLAASGFDTVAALRKFVDEIVESARNQRVSDAELGRLFRSKLPEAKERPAMANSRSFHENRAKARESLNEHYDKLADKILKRRGFK